VDPTCWVRLPRILLPLFSLEMVAGVYSPAVISRTNCPSRPIYKRPQHPLPRLYFPLRARHSKDGGIRHRSPAHLRASPAKFIAHGEPRIPLSLISSLLSPGAPL
jgi:hypothetical protein